MPYHDPFNADLPFNYRPSYHQPQTTAREPARTTSHGGDDISSAFFEHASAPRINTDIHIYEAIKAAHPDVEIIDTDVRNINLIRYISITGDGSIEPLGDSHINEPSQSKSKHSIPSSLNWTIYTPPYRRLDGGTGSLTAEPIFDKFLLKWHTHEFLLYIVDARDGTYPMIQKRQFILTSDPSAAYTLLKTVGSWQNVLHDEIWVFNQGFWQKDAALYQSIKKSNWTDIILPEDLKEDLLNTVLRFYDSRETYERLRVPWKRGLIFYGPPGNGKTVSIKATMKTLYDRKEPVPTLYVKSLTSFGGPEYSINQIFAKARQEAPCYLVFEDLDSLVTDAVRSFFLNAVDGLSENEGILMVGSTNHLDRLDPGIAKRPSRFDRKYLFPDPDLEGRRRYCGYWQRKLKGNEDVEFPDELLSPIAGLMGGFSFAYMQEAFVSTLLRIANGSEGEKKVEGCKDAAWDMVELQEELEEPRGDDDRDGDDGFNKYILWREIKVQIANLRKELKEDHE